LVFCVASHSFSLLLLLSFVPSGIHPFAMAPGEHVGKPQEKEEKRQGKKAKAKAKSKTKKAALAQRAPPTPRPPRKLITAMQAAGATNDELGDEDVRILRVDGVQSEAWRLYSDWVHALKKGEPMLDAAVAPPAGVLVMSRERCGPVMWEVNSIVEFMAPLSLEEIVASGIPDFDGPVELPTMMPTYRDARVGLTPLLQTLANPGPKFPGIHALPSGCYVCHVYHQWGGTLIEVTVFRS
jgi:hypothetical protein